METNKGKRTIEGSRRFTNRSFKFMFIGTGIMLIAAAATAVVFNIIMHSIINVEQGSGETYDKHYIYIVDDNEDELWSSVYKSAKEEASKKNIFLEDLKASIKVNYSNEDLLRVAINSSVDGIVYSGVANDEVIALIDEAVEKGIGIAVLKNDIDTSQRQCFVGINNYELGQMYATQILKIFEKDEMAGKTVSILASKDMAEGATNLVVMAIEDAILEKYEEGQLPEIEITRINAEDTFSVEEEIRNIFLMSKELPDVMICLDSMYTQCVNQAVVDYNKVGELQIIGYFANEDILEAIDKQVIFSTVSIDTEEMGKSCITALDEYNHIGYTNSYMPVSMEVIGQREARKRVQSMYYSKENE